jgi:hypothetical protein
MADIFDQIERVWDTFKRGHAPLPVVAALPPHRCHPDGSAGAAIRRDEGYFTVRVNEMHLSSNRQWYTVYDPLVLVVCEFNHGRQRITVPTVIGPNLILKQAQSQNPRHGSVLFDTRVTGPHPYRGGDVDVSVSFYQVQRMNYARTLIGLVERLSGVIGAAGQLSMIAKTGAALLEGVEGLLGLEGTVMLAGLRICLATSPLDPFSTGFYGMIAPPVPGNPGGFLVRDRRLYVDSAERGESPYRDSDFVLLGISASATRDDESLLPFFDLKTDALNALWEGEDGLERAKANLIAAYQQMRKCPDITAHEAGILFDKWLGELDAERARVEQLRPMALNDDHEHVQTALIHDLSAALRRVEEKTRPRAGMACGNTQHPRFDN